MEHLMHFTHSHVLTLVRLQPITMNNDENSDEDDENDFPVGDHHSGDHGQCNMCYEHIYSFHLCYYDCNECDYSLHKFCAELPTIVQNHPLHPSHNLTLAKGLQRPDPTITPDTKWTCSFCNRMETNFFNYYCSICKLSIDIICATMSQQKMNHPSHPHQLQRMSRKLVSSCNACRYEHEGAFYHCTSCSWFWIHVDCALLPTKLLIQQPTNGCFTHSHQLTLSYSFPNIDQEAKLNPRCRVCKKGFHISYWLYKCDKCRYYVHSSCATSKYIDFLYPGHGRARKNYKDEDARARAGKNYKDEDHPNLLHCPFPDESCNLLKNYYIFNQNDFIVQYHGEILEHFSHQHPLILVDTQSSLLKNSGFLHDPMKKVQVLCNGCVKPITTMPFYKCNEDHVWHCGFALHEWCARLPPYVENHPGHRKHKLVLTANIPTKVFGVFFCNICKLYSNGFAYGCSMCEYYVDINCAFLPKVITHEAHPDHLLSWIYASPRLSKMTCNACDYELRNHMALHCPSCDFYLDIECAFLLPKEIRHKYHKHPLSLRYEPTENHPSNYFCEICEDELDPEFWYYHCSVCADSMHLACAPIILGCEQALYGRDRACVFAFTNVKFGGTLKTIAHPHALAFVLGIECHGQCKYCKGELKSMMIFKCLECEYAIHYKCVSFV